MVTVDFVRGCALPAVLHVELRAEDDTSLFTLENLFWVVEWCWREADLVRQGDIDVLSPLAGLSVWCDRPRSHPAYDASNSLTSSWS